MKTLNINQLSGKLDNNTTLAAFAKCYESYSYDYDCRCSAKRFDDMVTDFTKLKMDAKTASDLELYSRQIDISKDVLRYVTKYGVFESLLVKARDMLADIAAKEEIQRCASAADWDRRISALLGQELSIARCDKVKQLQNEFSKVPSDVKAKCKEAGRLTEAVSRDGVYRDAAIFDERVASLAKMQITTEERAKEVIAFSKENLGKKEMLRYSTRLGTLSDLCNKAQAVLTEIANKVEAGKCADAADWDRRIKSLLGQTLSLSWCEDVEKLFKDFIKLSAEIRNKCKEGTSLKSAYCKLDVYLSAAMLDQSIQDLANLPINEQLCEKVEGVEKEFNGSPKEVRETCAKGKLLVSLREQAVQYLKDEAKRLDDRFERVQSLSRSSANIVEQKAFISEWEKASKRIKDRCKVAKTYSVTAFVTRIGTEEKYLAYEIEIDDLTTLSKTSRDLSWCSRVEKLWSKAEGEKLTVCRNYDKLKAAKAEAERIRLETDCKAYLDALDPTTDYETVFKLDKTISSKIDSLRKLQSDFIAVWSRRLDQAKKQMLSHADELCEEALATSDEASKEKLFKKAVELGSEKAAYELAKHYFYRARAEVTSARATTRYRNAVNLFLQAYDKGKKEAAYFLGFCYLRGFGCVRDQAKGFKYLKDCEKSHPENFSEMSKCYDLLGECYSMGNGTTIDKQDASWYYHKAAMMEDPAGMYHYAEYIEKGVVNRPDEDEAMLWYEKSAKLGYNYAQDAVNRILKARAERKKQREEELRREELDRQINLCYAKAKKGDAQSQYELGEYYFTGNGVTLSYDDAFIWFEKAAKRGHKKAMERLGDCYYNGYGVTQNYSKAEKWYTKASK